MHPGETTIIRARITRDEWRELQKLALDRNTAPADLVAEAIRKTFPNLTEQESRA